jgi:hypothetical protein
MRCSQPPSSEVEDGDGYRLMCLTAEEASAGVGDCGSNETYL